MPRGSAWDSALWYEARHRECASMMEKPTATSTFNRAVLDPSAALKIFRPVLTPASRVSLSRINLKFYNHLGRFSVGVKLPHKPLGRCLPNGWRQVRKKTKGKAACWWG